jgi:hypothetical protein
MKTAKEMFDAAFSGVRTPRSPEYKLGMLSHLEYRLGEKSECKCPYAEGTAAHDAFWSGVVESWLIIEKNENVAAMPNDEKLTDESGRE